MSTVHETASAKRENNDDVFVEADQALTGLRAQFSITIDEASGAELVSQLISVIRRRLERQGMEALLGIDHSHGSHTEIFGWILIGNDCDPPDLLLPFVNDISADCAAATVRLHLKPREQNRCHARGVLTLCSGRNFPDSWLPECCYPWACLPDQLEVFGMTTLPLIQSQRQGNICHSKNMLGITASIATADIPAAAARFGALVLQLHNSGQLEEASYWLMGKESVHRYLRKP